MNFILQIIVGVVLSLASTLLQQAFAKPQDQRRQTGTRGAAQIGGKVPQYFLMGTVGEPGKREYRNSWGENDGVPNAYVTDVHSFGDLPITAMTGLYVNGVRVSIPTTGAVAQGYPVPEYSGHLWWKFFDGTQTAADSYLVSKFGGDADRAWASDMVGRGVPYLITTALWSETLWTGFPSYVGEFQGIKLYDPRKDSTAGGSGPQRWGQPETYAFSDNNLVMIYNIERGIYYEGQHVWGGRKTAAELPYAAWAAAMDACDQTVALAEGGSEKRFRAGRRVNLNERPADVIRELLIGANARISHAADGTAWPLVGVPTVADGAFSDADVLATEPLGSIPFPNLDEIINGATATYREPQQAWEDKETAPYYRSDLEAEDDGRRQTEGLDLGTTFSGTQAQRILKAVVEEGRRFRKHVVALPPEFAQFRPLQVLAWTSDRFDYSAKLFLITARTVEPFGNVVLGLQEIDPADHNWVPANDQKPLSFAPVVTNRPPPQEVSGPSVAPVPGELAYDVFWSAPSVAVDVDFVRVSHRVPPSTNAQYTVVIPKPDLLTGSARIPVPLSLAGETIEVQLEYIALSGRPMVASAWMPVTIADVRIGWEDMTAELRETLEGVQEFMDEEVPAIRDELADMGDDLNALAGAPVFAYGTSYALNDLVRYSGGIYRATVANSDVLPTDVTKWVQVGEYNSVADTVIGFTARFENVETTVENTANSLIQTTRDTRRIQNALLAAAMLNAEQGQNQVLENTDQLAATAQVSETVRTEVSRIDGTTTALAEQINVVQAQVANDVAQAISAVTTQVQDVDGRVTAEAGRIDSLRAVVGSTSSEVLIKANVTAGSGGPNSTYSVRLQNTNGGAPFGGGVFFMTLNGAGVSTLGLKGTNTVVYDDLGNALALFDSTGANFNNARIKNLKVENMDATFMSAITVDANTVLAQNAAVTGVLTVGSKIVIDGPNGRIVVSD